MNKANLFGIFISTGLGVGMIYSSWEHFMSIRDLDAHYQQVGLGHFGRVSIGVLQLTAGVCFLISKTRKIAAIIFSSVMLAIIIYSFIQGSDYFPWMAQALFCISLIDFLLLKKSTTEKISK